MNSLKNAINNHREALFLEKAFPNSKEFDLKVKEKFNQKVKDLAELVKKSYLSQGATVEKAEERYQAYLKNNLAK